jgi:hypothetical protein
VRHQEIQRTIFKSLQSSVQGGVSLLLNGNLGLRSRGIPVPLGKWGEIRFLPRCVGSGEEIILTVQNDITNNQKHLRKNYGRGQHNRLRRARRHGQEPTRIRPHLGRLRADLRAGTYANRS